MEIIKLLIDFEVFILVPQGKSHLRLSLKGFCLARKFQSLFKPARVVYSADGAVRCTAPSASYKRPTQRLSRPPPIQKLGAGNHMLQLNF